MTPPHSPLPWTVSDLYFGDELVPCANIVDADGLRIVRVVDRDNAALIVTAVNAHEKIRKALEFYAAEINWRNPRSPAGTKASQAWRDAGELARAALAGE
jgi:hypothetical protein